MKDSSTRIIPPLRYYRGKFFLNFYHPTFVVLPPLHQVFFEVESVVAADPEVFVLVFVAVELSPEVVALAAGPEVFALVFVAVELSPEVVVLAAEPGVFALVFVAVELFPEVVALAAGSEVFVLAAEPGVFVAVVPVADVAEPRASVDIAVAFVVLVPVCDVVGEVDSSGRPKFFAFPNICSFPNPSSSGGVVGEESVHSPTDVRTNYDLCSILSNLGLHQNKNLEHCYNNPNPGYNNVNDTNDLPKNATTNHSRNRSLHQCQGQRRHTFQVSLSPLVVRQI